MTELLDALGQPHAQFLLRVVLGGLLLLAGVAKLADRAGFRDAITEYAVVPRALEQPFAAALPWAETTLGALLLLGVGTTVAAALAVPLLGSFAGAIAINLARGRHIDCHCFGAVQSERIGWPVLVRAALLVVAALVVALGASPFGTLEGALWASQEGLPSASQIIPLTFLAGAIFDALILLPEAFAVREGLVQAYRVRITGARAGHGHPLTPITGNGRSAS